MKNTIWICTRPRSYGLASAALTGAFGFGFELGLDGEVELGGVGILDGRRGLLVRMPKMSGLRISPTISMMTNKVIKTVKAALFLLLQVRYARLDLPLAG